MTDEEIREALTYIRGVLPPKRLFDDLVKNGASGHEEHVLAGDDLAGACWELDQLMRHFGVSP